MKELLQFLLGIALTIIGVIIFLQNVVVLSLIHISEPTRRS